MKYTLKNWYEMIILALITISCLTFGFLIGTNYEKSKLMNGSHADSCWENLQDLDVKYQECLDNWEKEVIK